MTNEEQGILIRFFIVVAIFGFYLYSQHQQIASLQNQLQGSQDELSSCQDNLSDANDEISSAHNEANTDYENMNYTLNQLQPINQY